MSIELKRVEGNSKEYQTKQLSVLGNGSSMCRVMNSQMRGKEQSVKINLQNVRVQISKGHVQNR